MSIKGSSTEGRDSVSEQKKSLYIPSEIRQFEARIPNYRNPDFSGKKTFAKDSVTRPTVGF